METKFVIEDGVLVRCEVHTPEVIIPEGVRVISYGAFKGKGISGTDELVNVTIPKSVEEIEDEAFIRCNNLRSVTILGAARIGRSAFSSCHSLEEVYLADEVEAIGSECFAYSDRLREVYIPKSVKKVGYGIAIMNNSSYKAPTFYCYRKGAGAEWDSDWNMLSYDPRFGRHSQYTYYHTTYFGMLRNGEKRAEEMHVEVKDMPHGTGEYMNPGSGDKGVRMPDIKLRLWLTATRLGRGLEKEYKLDEEEREMIVHNLYSGEEAKHQLDEPWTITVNDDTLQLAPKVDIQAWINDAYDVFDGKTIVVHHDMPLHTDHTQKYPVSLLREGDTVVAEKYIMQNNGVYDVRLHIQWLKQEMKTLTVKECMARLRQLKEQWAEYDDDSYEIEVDLAHGKEKTELLKCYKPSEFPETFIADLTSDGNLQCDLTQIVVQPYKVYQVCHSVSDDYRDAAEAYGEDCSDWYTTERSKTGERVSFEIRPV